MAKFKDDRGVAAPMIHLNPCGPIFLREVRFSTEGDLGLAMYVIEMGEVEIRKKLGEEERILATLGKGDFFGEMCMLDEETPRSATAIALVDVDVVTINQSAFTFILTSNPEIAIRMMRKLSIRLRQTTELLEDAVGHKVDIESSAGTMGPNIAAQDPKARVREISTGMLFSRSPKRRRRRLDALIR